MSEVMHIKDSVHGRSKVENDIIAMNIYVYTYIHMAIDRDSQICGL